MTFSFCIARDRLNGHTDVRNACIGGEMNISREEEETLEEHLEAMAL